MKIEKGCLAIVVNGGYPEDPDTNIGKIVKVGKFIGYVPGYDGNDRWEVDKPMSNDAGGYDFHNNEKNLQRIDEPTEQETITDELEITESA